ncbi:APC family permease [Pelomonas aquatica]|jgi:amino acid transporter|uniref:APC family permease n=1 Tax=Pelomonas aquatica TaxID=431058 RepID=A0A9X4LI98_9BURK|nr:APC family permease [Pelomonas aquatica]MCY4757135.1 APC family permease [Pelomonas aquatica]MDG0864571.1 APC family permease [Pelomonas aquatica]
MSQENAMLGNGAGRLLRVLTYWDLVVYGLAYISPLGPFSTWGFALALSGGAAPLAFALGAAALLFTAISYASMAKEVAGSGSAFGYARAAMGDMIGFLTGWMVLLDYLLLPALMYVLFGIGMSLIVPDVPRWAWILVMAAYNIGVNWFGVKNGARFNTATLVGQFLTLALVIGWTLHAMHTHRLPVFTAGAWWGPASSGQGVLAATSLCLMSYLGFDAITTLTGEVRSEQRHLVGRAVLTTLAAIAVLAVMQVWIFADLAAGFEFKDLATASFEAFAARVDPALAQIVTLAMSLTLAFSISPPMVVAVSRVLHSMASHRQMPAFLGHLHPRYGVPDRAILASGALSIAVALPFADHFDTLTSMVNFGAILAFIAVNASVIAYYRIRRGSPRLFVHLILPLIGIVILLMVLTQMSRVALAVGGAWMLVGLVVAALLRARGTGLSSAEVG